MVCTARRVGKVGVGVRLVAYAPNFPAFHHGEALLMFRVMARILSLTECFEGRGPMGDEEMLRRVPSRRDVMTHSDLRRVRSKVVDQVEQTGTVLRASLEPSAAGGYHRTQVDPEFTRLLVELPLPEGDFTLTVQGRICNSAPYPVVLFCLLEYPGASVSYDAHVEGSPDPVSPVAAGIYDFVPHGAAHFAAEGNASIRAVLDTLGGWWYSAATWLPPLLANPISITAQRVSSPTVLSA